MPPPGPKEITEMWPKKRKSKTQIPSEPFECNEQQIDNGESIRLILAII